MEGVRFCVCVGRGGCGCCSLEESGNSLGPGDCFGQRGEPRIKRGECLQKTKF